MASSYVDVLYASSNLEALTALFLFSDTGRGLMTKRSISVGDMLISLPKTLLITTETVLTSQAGEHVKK